jgi:hypothetical protein
LSPKWQQKLFGARKITIFLYHNIKKLLIIQGWQDYQKAWVATLVDKFVLSQQAKGKTISEIGLSMQRLVP